MPCSSLLGLYLVAGRFKNLSAVQSRTFVNTAWHLQQVHGARTQINLWNMQVAASSCAHEILVAKPKSVHKKRETQRHWLVVLPPLEKTRGRQNHPH
jgi:hypothetical protein